MVFGTEPVLLYTAVNLAVFLIYAFDKIMAAARRERMPESVLLLAAMAGPFGALFAMVLVRHKTRHRKFLLVPVLALLHLLAAGLWNQAIP